jgi:hypothetical protein
MIAALLLAAAPTAVPGTVLDCRLATPGGSPVSFVARLKEPGVGAAVLEPALGTAWPSQRVIGGGSHQVKGSGIKSRHHFAGEPGIELDIDGERATLFATKKLRRELPRAYGFCLPAPAAARAAEVSNLASVQAGAAIAAFDPAGWPDHCELVTRSGRRWKIGYSRVGDGRQSGLTATSAELFGKISLLVSRRGGMNKARFGGGKDGPAGSETLLLPSGASHGVQLIDFDRTALADAEPAAAICGIRTIVRRPHTQ